MNTNMYADALVKKARELVNWRWWQKKKKKNEIRRIDVNGDGDGRINGKKLCKIS